MAEQTDVRPVGARTRRRRHVRRQTRRSLIHTTLALIPGAGLLGTRYRRLGWVMLGLLAAMVVVVALFVLAKGAVSAALNVAVRPDALLAVAGLTVVGGSGLDLLDHPHPPRHGARPRRRQQPVGPAPLHRLHLPAGGDPGDPGGPLLAHPARCRQHGLHRAGRRRPHSVGPADRHARGPGAGPVGRRRPRQPAAARFGRRQRPRGHAHRLHGRGEHRPADRQRGPYQHPAQPGAGAVPEPATRCTSSTPTATTAPAPLPATSASSTPSGRWPRRTRPCSRTTPTPA